MSLVHKAQCKSASLCESVDNVVRVLAYYSKIMSLPKTEFASKLMSLCKEQSLTLLDDYIHTIECHDDFLGDIMNKCQLKI